MVKFGRHLQFFLDLEGRDDGTRSSHNNNTTPNTNHYIVPYNVMRDAIESPAGAAPSTTSDYINKITPESFEMTWKEALARANLDYSESINSCWKTIFDSISSYEQEEQEYEEEDEGKFPGRNNNCIKPVKVTTRGMELMDAIKVYTQINDVVTSMDLLCFLKDTYNAAEINYQALRKIVKKFDKKYYSSKNVTDNVIGGTSSNFLSVFLLPELYSSILFAGRGTLNITICYLRQLIEEMSSSTSNSEKDSTTSDELNKSIRPIDEIKKMFLKDDDDGDGDITDNEKEDNDNGVSGNGEIELNKNHVYGYHAQNQFQMNSYSEQKYDEDSQAVMKLNDEVQWLNNIAKDIPQSEMSHIVSHRGFHSPQDRSDCRPLENSLSAFETAWSAGIHLCECDVALTKDEKLVLAHDENFNRLALDKFSNSSTLKVSELTFKELIALTLKNGVRAPLLKDVLMSANAIGPHAKLIIEIKPGNREAAKALSRLLVKYPELIAHIAVIMSFDLWSMHSLCADLQMLFPDHYSEGKNIASGIQHQYLSTSILGTSPKEENRRRSNSLIDYDVHQKVSFPKLMVLTVADQPESSYELCTTLSDYSQIDGWLNAAHTSLDGVYVRYEPQMMSQEGKQALLKLAKRCTVGIWSMFGEDPDDYGTMKYLVNVCDVSFYNTDWPRTFY